MITLSNQLGDRRRFEFSFLLRGLSNENIFSIKRKKLAAWTFGEQAEFCIAGIVQGMCSVDADRPHIHSPQSHLYDTQ